MLGMFRFIIVYIFLLDFFSLDLVLGNNQKLIIPTTPK